MAASTTKLFEHIKVHQTCTIHNHQFVCPSFMKLRDRLWQIFRGLEEADDYQAKEAIRIVRYLISEILTTPIELDEQFLDRLQEIGTKSRIASRWGQDLALAFDDASIAVIEMALNGNPLRAELATTIENFLASNIDFRVYCHRHAAPRFQTLFPDLDSDRFIHTTAQYREQETFTSLIKVGPLRSRGWGSAPDAILTAPRFSSLYQFTWSGCHNEPDFGYDPSTALGIPCSDSGGEKSSRIGWSEKKIRIGATDSIINDAHPDELNWFSERTGTCVNELVSADMLHLEDGYGVLFSPRSRVLSFDPNAEQSDAFSERLSQDTLDAGMFHIVPVLNDIDLGSTHGIPGQFYGIWKRALDIAMASNIDGIVEDLIAEGLDFVNIKPRLADWKRKPTTVIHAPRRQSDFRGLITVLTKKYLPDAHKRIRGRDWWEIAWAEIRRSRGERIQSGMVENQIVNEELVRILSKQYNYIQELTECRESFDFTLPENVELSGKVHFHFIVDIEDGYIAPRNELGTIHEVKELVEWRV